jgi:hypothetical protein
VTERNTPDGQDFTLSGSADTYRKTVTVILAAYVGVGVYQLSACIGRATAAAAGWRLSASTPLGGDRRSPGVHHEALAWRPGHRGRGGGPVPVPTSVTRPCPARSGRRARAPPRRCWIRADARPHGPPSTCGNCQPVHDHPDLRGHQPDPAHGHGPAAPQVAAQIASDDRLVRTAYDHRPLFTGARAWLSGAWRGSAQHLAQWCHGRVPSAGRGGSVRVRVGGLVWHRGNGAVGGRARRRGSTWIRTRCSRL